jgi:hypothetical protein
MGNDKTPPKGETGQMTESVTTDGAADPAVEAGRQTRVRLDPRVRAHIGSRIKAVYDEVLEEPVPDRFVALLDELASKERNRK